MIGFYNYSVILTYIGLVSSVFGITQVFENHMSIAFLCLLLSGICDLFDASIMIVLGAVIRLGYFNVMEEERQRNTTENRKEYKGLPVTTVAMILPLLFMGQHNIPKNIFPFVFHSFMILISILFVLKINVKKLSMKGVLILFTIGAIILLGYLKMQHII